MSTKYIIGVKTQLDLQAIARRDVSAVDGTFLQSNSSVVLESIVYGTYQ